MLKLFALILAVGLSGCFSQEENSGAVIEESSASQNHPARELIGEGFPELDIENLLSSEQRLTLQNVEKPTLVNVWATWCPPCVKELPYFVNLQSKGEFAVKTISTDKQKDVINTFLARNEIENLSVWHDPFGTKSREYLKAIGLPVTFLVNTDGTIVRVDIGERKWDHPDMIQLMQNALKEG